MTIRNEFLRRRPFDLYELQLIRLVAASGSFTRAAQQAGLTQSAVTRQVRGVEERLGVTLFERTTRKVILTDAGEFFLAEARRISGDVEALTVSLTSAYAESAPLVRIGLARSIALAYYPGFLVASRRKQPELLTQISQDLSRTLIKQLEEGELDVVVVTTPRRLSRRLKAVHQFEDAFVMIASDGFSLPDRVSRQGVSKWAKTVPWILLHEGTETGRMLRQWLKLHRLPVEASMQVDNFDLIINLVALGLGASFVPHRALALYGRKRGLRRIPMKDRFHRQLSVLVRRQRTLPESVQAFVEGILF
jgi:DNA-binding transcriptional LysR family regulator